MFFDFPETFGNVATHKDAQGETWFHAGAICAVLGYKNVSQTVNKHCCTAQTIQRQDGRGRPSLFVSESGLYLLIMASKSPLAVKFRYWIAREVLQSLRETGGYQARPEIHRYFVELHKQLAE